jgi:4-amino-4-deoxy-L-arabinose transferase-like glycosyltransferase
MKLKPFSAVNQKPGLFYLMALAALIPVLLFRDFTPSNELRYLSIADEALRQHHLFTFWNHGVPYADKPPLYFWIIMACRRLTGDHYMWLLSMFSVVPALLVVRLMDRWTAPLMQTAYHHTSRLILLTCAYFLGAALTLRMDMLMTLFILLALRSFWRMHTEPTCARREAWLFPLYLFLALFTKGPLGILIPLCGTLVYLGLGGEWRSAGRYWGWRTWTVLLAGCAMWFSAVYLEGGGEYLHNLLFHQTVDRAVNSFRHDHAWYYYLVSYWYALAPWSPLLVVGLVLALRRLGQCTPLHRYFLTVSLTSLVLLSCISSKLEVYLLPAYPFMVYAALLALQDYSRSLSVRLSLTLPATIFALAFPAYLVASGRVALLQTPMLYVAAGVLSLLGVLALVQLYTDHTRWAVRSVGGALLAVLFIGGCTLPQLNDTLGYRLLCQQVKAEALEHHPRKIHSWRLSNAEDMDIYLGREVHALPKGDIPAADSLQDCLLLTPKENVSLYPQHQATIVGPDAIIVCRP